MVLQWDKPGCPRHDGRLGAPKTDAPRAYGTHTQWTGTSRTYVRGCGWVDPSWKSATMWMGAVTARLWSTHHDECFAAKPGNAV